MSNFHKLGFVFHLALEKRELHVFCVRNMNWEHVYAPTSTAFEAQPGGIKLALDELSTLLLPWLQERLTCAVGRSWACR